MARPIRNIDIYLPLNHNDGRPIPESKYITLQQELLSRFGGVTSMQRQFPLQGLWRSGEQHYHDQIVVMSVMDFRTNTQLESLRFLEKLKRRLKRKFEQLEILITVTELLAI